jgi:hypothetical protein
MYMYVVWIGQGTWAIMGSRYDLSVCPVRGAGEKGAENVVDVSVSAGEE